MGNTLGNTICETNNFLFCCVRKDVVYMLARYNQNSQNNNRRQIKVMARAAFKKNI